jgi:hypothetical protein
MQNTMNQTSPDREMTYFYHIIYQEVLCKRDVNTDHVLNIDLNFTRVRSSESQKVHAVLEGMAAEHTDLLYNPSVRWLSMGEFLKSVWNLQK